jgi:hypothetical protein
VPKFRIVVIVSVFSLLIPLTLAKRAAADTVTYSYTGSDFESVAPYWASLYTTSDSITGTLVLSAALPDSLPSGTNEAALVLSYSFSDGVQTLTQADAFRFSFYCGTSSTGQIIYWTFDILTTQLNEIHSQNEFGGSPGDEGNFFPYGANTNIPGVWSGPVSTPEPEIRTLLYSGIVFLGLLVWFSRFVRREKKGESLS